MTRPRVSPRRASRLVVGRGLATRDIARQLDLSVKTIETCQSCIKEKLGLTRPRVDAGSRELDTAMTVAGRRRVVGGRAVDSPGSNPASAHLT